MQGYGVLPSAPMKIRVTNVDVDYAILHWDPPEYLGDSVINYDLHVRQLQQQEYQIIHEVFLLLQLVFCLSLHFINSFVHVLDHASVHPGRATE